MPDKRILINYAQADRNVARMIGASLSAAGAVASLRERDITAGDAIDRPAIGEIGSPADLLYLISKSSVTSPWVNEELRTANIRRRQEQGFRIFPVVIDGTERPASLAGLRYSDLSGWRESGQYRRAMLGLLGALDLRPHRLNWPQAEWWVSNRVDVNDMRIAITECFQVATIAIGFRHWFDREEPYRWAYRWIGEEYTAGSLSRYQNLVRPVFSIDPRFEVIHDSVDQMARAHMRSWRDQENDIREFREAAGRVITLLDELETEVLTAVLSAVDFA